MKQDVDRVREREPRVRQAAKVARPDDVRDERDPTATGQVLELQRSAGNSAVSGLLADDQGGNGHVLPARLVQRAASAPAATEAPGKRETLEIPEVTREHMRADVERIVALLQKQILWSSEEAEIVQMVFHWTEVDRLNLESGHNDTRNIDEFLLLLKKRAFPRATARSAWQETWVNAYDTLWYELEDDNLQRFAQLVATSRKQATTGPEGEHTENFWSTLGKQEALGVWGTLKGMGLTLSGLADAAIWWQWKVSGLPLRTVLDALGVKLGSEPPQLSPWLDKQYDVVAKEMGHAFGIDPTKDETLLGQSSYEIGEFGGKIVGALTLAGAGEAGGVSEGVQAGVKGLQLAQAFQGIDQSAQKIVDRIIEIREARPNATWDEILLDAKVLLEAANILVALMSVFGSFDDAAPTFTEAFKKMKLPIALVSIAPLIQKAWIDYNDPKLASDKEARDKALRDDVAAIMSAVAVLVGTSVGGAKEGEKRGGQEGGGGGGPGEGGGGGGGGDSPFGETGGELGDGTVLEPHPADPQTGQAKVDPETGKSLPEFIPDEGVAVDPKVREELLAGGGGEIGEPDASTDHPDVTEDTIAPAEEKETTTGLDDDEKTGEIEVPKDLLEDTDAATQPVPAGGPSVELHGVEAGVPGPNTLTPAELAELQAIADRHQATIDVIGSRAEGRGRNIDQPNLPEGKGEGTRSDIDIRIDGDADIRTRGQLSNDIAEASGGAGKVSSSTGPRGSSPPFIRIRPRRPE